MERPRISNSGTGVDRLEMSFDGKSYVHGQHSQLLMIEEKYDTSKDINTYMSLAHDVIFTHISAKKVINQSREREVVAMLKEYQKLNDRPMPGNPVFGTINNEELRSEDRKKSIDAVKMIKEKLCGNIKGRTCENGIRQKIYLKEDKYV